MWNGEIKYNIFSEVRPEEHRRMKKPVAKYWTTSSVARMEPHIDTVIAFMCKQFADRFATGAGHETMGEAFDFGEWCMFCEPRFPSSSAPISTVITTADLFVCLCSQSAGTPSPRRP